VRPRDPETKDGRRQGGLERLLCVRTQAVLLEIRFLGLPGRTSTAYSIKGTGAPEEVSRQKILDKERVLPYWKTF